MTTTLRDIISSERLTSYLQDAGFDDERAIRIYFWNMKLSAAFFPVLGAAEVALRNRVVARAHGIYGPEWWRSANLITHLGKRGFGIVKRAEAAIAAQGKAVDSGRMTAQLSFGFWTKMLLPKYEPDLWTPISIGFPDLPLNVDLAALLTRCEQVRELRNRISHHEPIFQRNLTADYGACIELITWLSRPKAEWIRAQSDVMSVLRQKPR